MGSLDNKANQTSADLESECATMSIANESIVQNPLDNNEFNQFGSEKRLLSFTSCSSSISTDFSLEDPLQDSDSEHDKSSLKSGQLATEHDEKPNDQPSDSGVPISSSGPGADDPISQTPTIQVMERQATSKYRIPSHVFARKKSSAPGEWSMASNESLFSIQMGGNSFCNQDSLFLKSGELGLGYGAEASLSSRRLNLSYDGFLGGKTTEAGQISELDKTGESQELGEAGKRNGLGWPDEIHGFGVENNNQGSSILDEPLNSDNKDDRRSTADERTSHFSAESSSSTKSFVFPILAGETDKGNSPNPRGSLTGVPEEPKLEPLPQSPPKPAPTEPPSKPEASEAKAETQKATPFITWTKWFPCCRYCTCCS